MSAPLPFCRGEPTWELIADDSGAPVWPISSDEDLAALEALADTFGSSVREVRSSRVELAGSGDGRVLAAAPQLLEAATLYAHLTGRAKVGVWDGTRQSADVLVGLPVHLTSALLAFWEPPVSRPVGLVIGRSEAMVRRQVLLRSAALALSRRAPSPHAVVLSANGALATRQAGVWQMLGQRASPQDLIAALDSRPGVLALCTHSDGIDSQLVPGLVLCDLATGGQGSAPVPRCVATGWCHRHGAETHGDLVRARTIRPSQLSARILLNDGCSTAPVDGGLVHSDWNMLWPLLDNPRVGAIVANWEIAITGLDAVTPLIARLMRGQKVGSALVDALRELLPRRACLFGDPDARAGSPQRGALRPGARRAVSAPRRHSSSAGTARSFGRVNLLRTIVVASGAQGDPTVQRTLGQLGTAISEWEQAGWRGEPTKPSAARVQAATLEVLRVKGALFRDWLPFAKLAPGPREACSCGMLCICYVARMRIVGAADRRLSICPRCGVVEDSPQWAPPLRLTLKGNFVAIEGRLPAGTEVSGLLLFFTGTEASSWTKWPSVAGARRRGFRPANVCEIPATRPPGPLSARVMLHWSLEFGWLQTPLPCPLDSCGCNVPPG